jgi:hypothetical protein
MGDATKLHQSILKSFPFDRSMVLDEIGDDLLSFPNEDRLPSA